MEENPIKSCLLNVCTLVVVVFVLSPLLALWAAYAMHYNYTLFVASVPGAPQLTLLPFVGISLLASQLLAGAVRSKKEGEPVVSSAGRAIGMALLVPAIMLFLGWLYNLAIVGWMGIR